MAFQLAPDQAALAQAGSALPESGFGGTIQIYAKANPANGSVMPAPLARQSRRIMASPEAKAKLEGYISTGAGYPASFTTWFVENK